MKSNDYNNYKINLFEIILPVFPKPRNFILSNIAASAESFEVCVIKGFILKDIALTTIECTTFCRLYFQLIIVCQKCNVLCSIEYKVYVSVFSVNTSVSFVFLV